MVVRRRWASLLAGPLSENVFEPLMSEGAALASIMGDIIGEGPGRGMGLLFIMTGMLMLMIATYGYLYKPLYNVEAAEPDAEPTP